MPEKPEVRMNEGSNGKKTPFEERRMWRLLLARLHPDAGGDQELFLLASALRAGNRRDRLLDLGPAGGPSGAEAFLCKWRSAMDSWASDNRDALRRHRTRRTGTPAHKLENGFDP